MPATDVTRATALVTGAGEETAKQARPVLHPFGPGLDQRGELAEVESR
jgi:hypothetical protein